MTVGDQLKQAREARGLTIEQAAQATHVRIHYLEALENNQRNALPSAVQGRGFLRLYAGFLNLPEKEILAAWEGKSITEAPPPAPVAPGVVGPVIVEQPAAEEPQTSPEQIAPPTPTDAEVEDGESSQAIFEEIGRKFRAQRVALGLSLVEIERYTRLRQHYIQSIEDGRMEGLPSPVQGRGMISNYATFLNMDEEAILLRFAQGLQARRVERLPKAEPPGMFQGKKRPAKPAPLWRRFLTPDLLFGITFAAIILFYVLWSASRIGTLGGEEEEPTLPAISEILLTSGAPTPSPTFEQTTVAGETAPGDSEALPQATLPEEPVVPPLPVTEEATAAPTATLPSMNNDPLQVYIVARQRAWLRVDADGQNAFLGRVVPGNAYAFSGERQIEILTGNAAGLQVFFNQNDLGILGQTGQVVGMIFSPEGVITPTAAPTATAQPRPDTPTPLPTASPTVTSTVTPFVPD